MARAGLGALLLTTEPDFRYFSGFLTRFLESPSRPWFLIVPAVGKPVAVIPSIGAVLMGAAWIEDIRTWPAPYPEDDGVSLLAATLCDIGGPVGVPSGDETVLRMPLADYQRVQALSGLTLGTDHRIISALRAIKSTAETKKIANICHIAGCAFARISEIAGEGWRGRGCRSAGPRAWHAIDRRSFADRS
jgi:Xaa-Pro aminopeptidase